MKLEDLLKIGEQRKEETEDYLDQKNMQMYEKSLKEQETIYTKAKELAPNDYRPILNLANINYKLGNYEIARQLITETFDFIPKDNQKIKSEYFYCRGLIEEEFDEKKALLCYNRSIHLNHNAKAYRKKAMINKKRENLNEFIVDMVSCMNLRTMEITKGMKEMSIGIEEKEYIENLTIKESCSKKAAKEISSFIEDCDILLEEMPNIQDDLFEERVKNAKETYTELLARVNKINTECTYLINKDISKV